MKNSNIPCSDWLNNKHLGPLISLLNRSENTYIKLHLNEYNLGSGQLIFLRSLLTHKCLNQDFFAKHFHINKGSVARSIKSLEDKGFVVRKIDEENRRQYKITLTDKGKQVAEEVNKYEHEWEDLICEESFLSKEELQEELKKLIKKSIDSIEEYKQMEDYLKNGSK